MANPPKIEITSPSRRFPPVGRCIYCRKQDVVLHEEHIIPFAIAGNALILPAASCRECEIDNNKIEGPIHKRQLQPLRVVLNTPTRRPAERPESLPVGLAKFPPFQPGETAIPMGEVEVKAGDYPLVYIGLHLDKPGILLELPLGVPLEWKSIIRLQSDRTLNLLKRGANAVRIGAFNPYLSAQYLARIAYAYAVAFEGLDTFEPLVLDLIKGRTKYFRHWVGGDLKIPEPEPSKLHSISHGWVTVGNVRYLLVTLRLFSFLGTPIYRVVVGQIQDSN